MDILIGILVVVGIGVVPMLIYAFILWWLDRYEKEPWGLVLAAFLWGAIPAVIFSLIAQLVLDIPISSLMGRGLGADLTSAALIAPLTEEPFKALALLLLLLFFRREIDSPMDGILYGGLVGFGFAATENVFYFLDAYSSGGTAGVLQLATLRALLFGLNHALFTACTGLGIALARTSPRWSVKITAPILGLTAAMTLHGIHNAGATLAGELCWPLLISLASDWMGVLILVIIIIWALVRERAWINRYLADEINAGTISPHDYQVVGSYGRRWGERARALLHGDVARWWRLDKYYQLATELAFAKHRWATYERDQKMALHIEQLRRKLYDLRKFL